MVCFVLFTESVCNVCGSSRGFFRLEHLLFVTFAVVHFGVVVDRITKEGVMFHHGGELFSNLVYCSVVRFQGGCEMGLDVGYRQVTLPVRYEVVRRLASIAESLSG